MDSDYVNDRRTKEVMILLMLNRGKKVVKQLRITCNKRVRT